MYNYIYLITFGSISTILYCIVFFYIINIKKQINNNKNLSLNVLNEFENLKQNISNYNNENNEKNNKIKININSLIDNVLDI